MYAHCKLVPFRIPLRGSNTFVSVGNAITCLPCGQVKELPKEMLIPQPLWMKSKDDKKISCQGSGLHTFEGRPKLQPTVRGCQSDGWQKVTLIDKIGRLWYLLFINHTDCIALLFLTLKLQKGEDRLLRTPRLLQWQGIKQEISDVRKSGIKKNQRPINLFQESLGTCKERRLFSKLKDIPKVTSRSWINSIAPPRRKEGRCSLRVTELNRLTLISRLRIKRLLNFTTASQPYAASEDTNEVRKTC